MDELQLLTKIASYIDLEQNRPLNETIYEGLRKAVILGVIPAGIRINQKNLADYMHISRTPIRRSVEQLKEEGLLEEIPNYGVVVKRLSMSDAKEIFKIRVAIDLLATTTAMNLMEEKEFEEIDSLLAYTQQLNEEGRVEEVIDLFRQFNLAIYRYSKMPRLLVILKQLQEYLARFRDISLYADERRSLALRDHFLIAECMKNKDVTALSTLIEEHLNTSLEFILIEIQRYEESLNDI